MMLLRVDEGGAFEHVLKLSAGIADHGHEVAVCGLEARQREEFADRLGSRVDVLPVKMVREISPSADARGLAGMASAMRRFEPDIVHAHGSKEAALGRAARAVRPRTPFAYTPHGYAFAKPFMSSGERRVYRVVERLLSPLATRVICICEAERRLAMEVGPANRTRVVYNGIAPPGPGPTLELADRLRADGPVVCALSGLRVGKGIETLIEAFGAAVAEHPGASLVVAGEGPERAKLEQLASGLGVSDAIHLIGEVEDVFPVLRGADLFVHPSWAESFPYAVLEAMAAGVPAIATDVGGTREQIEHGEGGMLVPPRDAAALGNAISAMLEDRQRASAMAQAAGQRYRGRFTLKRMVEGTIEIYAELGV